MNDEREEIIRALAGVWQLISSEFRTAGGEVYYPLGEDASGLAIFTESGYMSGQLMRRARPDFAADNPAQGSDDEVRAALQGYVAYYGRCEVEPRNRTLTTRVEGSLFPNWVGGEQLRYYQLEGDSLVLTTPPLLVGEQELTGVLTWRRVA